MLENEEEFVQQFVDSKRITRLFEDAKDCYEKNKDVTEGHSRNICFSILKLVFICLIGFTCCIIVNAHILITCIFFVCLGLSGMVSFLYLSIYFSTIETWIDCIRDSDNLSINHYLLKLERDEFIVIKEKPKKWYSLTSRKELINLKEIEFNDWYYNEYFS